MAVALRGCSPAVLTAGILLLSRARSFGQRFVVEAVGDPNKLTRVEGPALVHSPVLASCGVGRQLGSGALVIVPGGPVEPIATSLSTGGTGRWFLVGRSGAGEHSSTRAFVRFCRDHRVPVRALGRQLRQAFTALGIVPEPALLDMLFAPDVPPLVRLSVAIRAGRAMNGAMDAPVNRYLSASLDELPDPLASPCTPAVLKAARDEGRLGPLLDRLSLAARDPVEDWLWATFELIDQGDDDYAELLANLVEIAGHVLSLPSMGMLPPIDSAMDAVAVGLGPALGAVGGATDATRSLADTFRFLGGTFTDAARFPVELDHSAPPQDRLERWRWFCTQTSQAAERADALWRKVVDPIQ